jgi:lysophospholipase L1-like esterase
VNGLIGSLLRSALVLLAAVVVGCHTSGPEPAPAERHDSPVTLGSGPPMRYLVLGDSTAAGVGADYEQGIVMETARHLAESHRIEVLNLAVSGARFRDVLRDQLSRARGWKPDLVLLDVGANDVTHLTSSKSVRRDLGEIIQALLAENCQARIVVTGSPDMGAPPRIPFFLRGIAANRARRINVIAQQAVFDHDLTFAPIAERTGPAFRSDRTLFAPDRFHPNARGYALWIPVLDEALDAALATQPGHCPGR